jgi:thiamine biosynthesis lipoprotein
MNPNPTSVFTHDAMNTTFSVHFHGAETQVMRDMALDCFHRVDFLEARLSRFADASDISRINHLRDGETLYISEETHRCLLAAMDAYTRTAGLFDITLGKRIEHRKTGGEGDGPSLVGSLTIHPDAPAVTCHEAGRQLDLGGIGKGFALDDLRRLLLDWDAPGGLIAAGASSLLAFGPDSWPVELASEADNVSISLRNESISASGIATQRNHILHPGGDTAMPAQMCRRLWVTASTATLAEIWSTALFLLEPEDILGFLGDDETVTGVFIQRESQIQHIIHGGAP